MSEAERVRASVRRAYARVLAPGARRSLRPRAVNLPGYTWQDVALVPSRLASMSLGCGNPLAFAELQEGEAVLDLGCGAGLDLLLAARRVGEQGRVIGVDMTAEMVACARANAAYFDNVEVRHGLIEELPVENGSVDWVISNGAIGLSPEKPRVFREIHRVLKPGGRVLVCDIVVRELPPWVRDGQALRDSCLAGALSEAEYVDGLVEAGLEDVEVRQHRAYGRSEVEAVLEAELDAYLSGDHRVLASEPLATALRALADAQEDALAALASTLVGRVWSAAFCARKAAAE